MSLEESSIYISLKQVRQHVFNAQFNMEKGARIIYGTPLLKNIGKSLMYFTLAFEVQEDKMKYLLLAIGYFAIVRTDLDFCVTNNIFHFPKRVKKDKDGKPVELSPEEQVSSEEIALFAAVAKADCDMCRWQDKLARGKTICG